GDALRSLALFATLGDEDAGRVLASARELAVPAGASVVEQWEVSRDLYVVLGGSVEVVADGARLNVLGPGEFFGELAAADWGAGFARTRAATVAALEETRLLALDWQLVNRLLKSDATFAEHLQQARRERLPTL